VCSLHAQDTTVPTVERTLPWSWYADPDVLRLEGDRIFARTWHVDQAWVDELVAFDTPVGLEDRALVEGVQRGVRSGVLAEGRLLSQSEQLVARFQRLCAEALTS
jgi:hypothetical protein